MEKTYPLPKPRQICTFQQAVCQIRERATDHRTDKGVTSCPAARSRHFTQASSPASKYQQASRAAAHAREVPHASVNIRDYVAPHPHLSEVFGTML